MASWKQQALIEAPVAEVWDILCDPARGPDWDKDLIAVTCAPTKIEQGSTFDVTGRGPLGLKATTTFKVEELEDLHELKMKCKSYLRREAEKLLDSLRRVVSRDRAGAT